MKTMKNKIAAIAILLASSLPAVISLMLGEKEVDCTYMVFIGALCICLFFSNESWFYEYDAPEDEVRDDES